MRRLRDLKRDDCRDMEDERILQRALEQGFVSRGDVSEVLGFLPLKFAEARWL